MRILFFLSLVLVTNIVQAQTDPTPKFESLKLNSSPAFVLLGVEPENLQRASSPKAFIAGLQQAIVNGKLKPNFAFEATPYYWKSEAKDSTRFRPEKFLLPNRSVWKNIAETFSFSLGTSESDTVSFGKLEAGTALGLGLRFVLVDGKAARPTVSNLKKWNSINYRIALLESIYGKMLTGMKREDAIRTAITDAGALVQQEGLYVAATEEDLSNKALTLRLDLAPNNTADDAAYLKAVDSLLRESGKEQKLILAKINREKVPFAKNGFMLEAAAGTATIFQNNQWKGLAHARTALWLTPSYRWQLSKDGKNIALFDLIGVIRYSINNKKDSVDVANFLDFGLKTQYTRDRTSFSLEGVYRRASQLLPGLSRQYTYRLVAALDYKLNDLVTFKFAFGSNFDGNTVTYSKPKEMFAVGGLNFGIFNSN